MEMAAIQYPTEKDKLYPLLAAQLRGLIEGVPHKTANLANASALLFDALTQINWAGFYLMKEGQLVLGPFQGKPACIEIAVGRGVCGMAVAQNRTQLVKNVHEFPGHIPCDSASNSEIVVPIHNGTGEVIGVLDIDSPIFERFDEEDQKGLEALVRIIETMYQ
ncbi:MAG: GAF domain-containing protein [Oscillospiraceae bacterium]|nr:GAF domain-containing protein [Oscillospiraceae bacterium]